MALLITQQVNGGQCDSHATILSSLSMAVKTWTLDSVLPTWLAKQNTKAARQLAL